MMLIDDREGSGDLAQPLARLGVPTSVVRLDAADAVFSGLGPAGDLDIAVETKRIPDVLDCMISGRFAAHQLPSMLEAGYDRIYLLVVGQFACDPVNGRLRIRHSHKNFWFDAKTGGHRGRPWMYREFIGWLMTMEELGGVRLAFAQDDRDEVRWLAGLYHWWTDKAYHEHSSLKTFVDYKGKVGHRGDERNRSLLSAPSLMRRIAKEIDGIGWEKSVEVEQSFGSVYNMVNATEDEWREIPGIGPKIAHNAVESLRASKVPGQPRGPALSDIPARSATTTPRRRIAASGSVNAVTTNTKTRRPIRPTRSGTRDD